MIVVRASAQPSVPLASGKLLGASVNARTAVTVPKPVGPRYRVRVEGDTSVAADKAPAPLKLVAEISGHPDQAEIFSGIKGLVPPSAHRNADARSTTSPEIPRRPSPPLTHQSLIVLLKNALQPGDPETRTTLTISQPCAPSLFA